MARINFGAPTTHITYHVWSCDEWYPLSRCIFYWISTKDCSICCVHLSLDHSLNVLLLTKSQTHDPEQMHMQRLKSRKTKYRWMTPHALCLGIFFLSCWELLLIVNFGDVVLLKRKRKRSRWVRRWAESRRSWERGKSIIKIQSTRNFLNKNGNGA